MYKLFLCLRYLKTRYIALASIVSVMLGVATMIVVNSVMSGFSNEMQTRIHGILGDLILESYSSDGFPDAEAQMSKIQKALGDDVKAMSPICTTAGIMNFRAGNMWVTQEVVIIGIDAATKGNVGDFSNYLQHPANRKQLSFDLREGGYDTSDHQAGPVKAEKTEDGAEPLAPRSQMETAGWEYRRNYYSPVYAESEYFGNGTAPGAGTTDVHSEFQVEPPPAYGSTTDGATTDGATTDESPVLKAPEPENSEENVAEEPEVSDPFGTPQVLEVFDPQKEQHTGAIVGIGLAMHREGGEDYFHFLPGQDFKLTFPTNTMPPKGITAHFTCVDLYESKMSEYDRRFIFLPLLEMQKLRGMYDPTDPRMSRVNQIQIKLREGVDLNEAKARLATVFDNDMFQVRTWRDDQMPLLQAVELETAILNVLLFMIIAVSGFGILAIFFMVVTEKIRDIGILKALGASSGGIMMIFLMYGLSLGIVGAGMGMLMGLLFVWNINEIATFLGWVLGRPVFDPDIYYFYQIPYEIDPWTVGWIVGGALLIAVLASIFPAWRASNLQPVESLRYE